MSIREQPVIDHWIIAMLSMLIECGLERAAVMILWFRGSKEVCSHNGEGDAVSIKAPRKNETGNQV